MREHSSTISRIVFLAALVVFVLAAFAANGSLTGMKESFLIAIGLACIAGGLAV